METIGILTLFPLLYRRCYEARMRNFALLENAPSAEVHGFPLVSLSAPSLFSCLVPLLSPLLRGLPLSPQPSAHSSLFLTPSSVHPQLITSISRLEFLCWGFLILISHLGSSPRFLSAPSECSTLASKTSKTYVPSPLTNCLFF